MPPAVRPMLPWAFEPTTNRGCHLCPPWARGPGVVLLVLGPEGPGAASAHREVLPRADYLRRGRKHAVGSVWSGASVCRLPKEAPRQTRDSSTGHPRVAGFRTMAAARVVPKDRLCRLDSLAPRRVLRRRASPSSPWPEGPGSVGEQPVPSALHPEGCAASGRLRSGSPRGPVPSTPTRSPRRVTASVLAVRFRRSFLPAMAAFRPPKGPSVSRAILASPKAGSSCPRRSTLRRVPAAAR